MIEFNKMSMRTWSRLGSCGAFGIAAMELPELDEKTVILTADLCFYSGLERYRAKYPDNFYNFGIAEQNMVGAAAGLAKEGYNVFATTYATFASTRASDQVKVNMGYMQLGIKLIGLTAGLSVGILGATHMSLEDVSIMRSIPNIAILSPADCTETVKAVIAASKLSTPVYIRLTGGMNAPMVYSEDYNFDIGKAINLRDGDDISIIATGSMVSSSLKAAEILEEQGISCGVVNMHTIKPLDTEAVNACLKSKLLVTVEEHSTLGGLGSAVAEAIALEGDKPPQLMIGTSDQYMHAANYDYLLEQYGLTAPQIAKKTAKAYSNIMHRNGES